MAKRFYRPHRGLYADAMAEKVEVTCLQDIVAFIESEPLVKDYYKNIRIAPETKREHREPNDDWGKDTYMVVADFEGYTGQCIGWANFCDIDVEGDERGIDDSQKKPADADDIILLGKPLSEYPETPEWITDKIKRIGVASFHNVNVYRYCYNKKEYDRLGYTIAMDGNSFRTTQEIIAYARLFVNYILYGADMTPIIPFIEKGLQFNIDYVAMLERVAPIFDEFEKYGHYGKYTIDHRFHLEFWQGRFSHHWANPEQKPEYV